MPRILLLITMALLSAVLLLRVAMLTEAKDEAPPAPFYAEPAEVIVLFGESNGLAVLVMQRHHAPQRRELEASAWGGEARVDVLLENQGKTELVVDLAQARLETSDGSVSLRVGAQDGSVWGTVLEGAVLRPLQPGTQRRCSLVAATGVAFGDSTSGWLNGVALKARRFPRHALDNLGTVELSALLRVPSAGGGGL